MDFQNPNDEPNLERRLILAFGLMVLLFLIVLPFLNKKSQMPPLAVATKAKPAATAPPAMAPGGAAPPAAAPAAPGKPATAPAAAKPAVVQAASEQTVAIDTPVYHIVFSNRGGVAKSWILAHYRDDAGRPLNVIDPTFSNQFGYPLAFWSPDPSVRQTLSQALYQVHQTAGPNGARTLTFTWASGGWQASKRLTFDQSYLVDIRARVTHNGQEVPMALAWQGAFGDRAVPGDFDTEQLFFQSGSSVDTVAAKNVKNGNTRAGIYQFAGVEDKYFALIFLPEGEPALTITDLSAKYQPRLTDASGNIITNQQVTSVGLAVAAGGAFHTRIFVGPKRIGLLGSIDPALRGLVDFGWFTFIAEPLFLWMKWTYTHWIPNYGWAILFLTFIITMATFPLKMKAQKNSAKMMAVQPKINALNAKMKKYGLRDPRRQEVQQEIMKVYSDHGVNFLGGCLPMFIQLPVIYAFWRVLDYAIELRHAPWFGYVHDLSARDPYFLLPLGVVLTQFFVMNMMPSMPGQDPRQQKLMKWLMPIMMGWFFFYLPAGVNLYYLGSNLIGAGQQWVANRTYNAAAVAAVAAKDARDAKESKAGGKGRVIEGKVVGPKK
jgi:YidC/Oxa1 family membrane protein insertase